MLWCITYISQTTYGADIISRIAFAVSDKHQAALLRDLLREEIGKQIAQMLRECPGCIPSRVRLVGNTVYAPGEKWERVTVPGELAMQGYGIEHDKPVLYKKTVLVADYRGKQVILRFDGVYSYARLWVNGKQVKLRGACRHDIHPTLGRTSTPELDSLDAALFKRANMNFVRTSHYPPTESFLKYCDREGIYVECETAVCFVDTYRQSVTKPETTLLPTRTGRRRIFVTR